MLSYTLFRALTFPITYLLATILVFTAIMQIKYVNRALQRFDATQVIPTQFVMFTLSVILGSAVLYRDFERTKGEEAVKFVGGCAMTFVGVWLITSAREKPSDNDDEFDDADDDAIVLRDGEQYQDDFPINGSQASIPHTIVETDEEDGVVGGSEGLVLRREDSNVSLPETLARNHWDSAAASTAASTPRRQLTGYGTSQPSEIDPASPLVENPWLAAGYHEQQDRPSSSLRRLLAPLSTVFSRQSQGSVPTLSAQAAQSAPELPGISRTRSLSTSS
jgi:hypothetical protein